ncbi:hypothetical protein BCN_P131 (plasmid) [Bacillus cereus NC7401]|nr:hypothetical protein BCN_P131 [Bacillus cereus NC7401]
MIRRYEYEENHRTYIIIILTIFYLCTNVYRGSRSFNSNRSRQKERRLVLLWILST